LKEHVVFAVTLSLTGNQFEICSLIHMLSILTVSKTGKVAYKFAMILFGGFCHYLGFHSMHLGRCTAHHRSSKRFPQVLLGVPQNFDVLLLQI
jgi:hypothetical protein